MEYEIKVLDLMDVDVESSFLVLAHDMGIVTRAKTWSYLILGGDDPILVDTGASSTEIMGRLGMIGYTSEEQRLENQLGRHGVAMGDVRWILHTHAHIDHAGQDDRFPDATVVMNRRELEFSASGLMGAQYPPEYVKHHIDRLHAPGALRLLDLELSGPDQFLPGIVCEATGGHTEGSMNILVETAGGTACLCGDIMYDVTNSVVQPYHVGLDREPQVTGNHAMTKRNEKAAIKKALNSGTFLLTGPRLPGDRRERPRDGEDLRRHGARRRDACRRVGRPVVWLKVNGPRDDDSFVLTSRLTSMRGKTAAVVAVACLVPAAGAAAATPSPAAYRAQVNALCRSYTPRLKKAEADLDKAQKANDGRTWGIALGTIIRLNLAQDKKIESTPVPAAMRAQMTPILSTLEVIDGHALLVIAKAAAGDDAGMVAELNKIYRLAEPLNKRLDAAGLRDCGSNQS